MNTFFSQVVNSSKRIATTFLIFFTLTFMAAELGQASVVGLWRFDDPNDPVKDSSGNGNTGFLVGDNVGLGSDPSFGFPSPLNGSPVMTFENDGSTSSYVEVPGNFSLPVATTAGDPWTIAAWAYEKSEFFDYQAEYGTIFHYRRTLSDQFPYPTDPNNPAEEYGITLQSGQNNTVFDDQYYIWHGTNSDLQIGTGANPNVPAPSSNHDKWTHYAVVYDSTDLIFYIDGVEETRLARPSLDVTYDGYNGALQIGGFPGTSNLRNWHGAIDDVAVFNEALDPNEVTTIKNGDFSAFINPLPQPTSAEWRASTFGEWNTSTNWDPLVTPDSTNITTVFGDQASTDTTVVNDNAVTVKGVQFDHTFEYAIAGTGSITIDSGGAGNGAISVLDSGGAEFQQPVNLASNIDVAVATGTTLEFDYPLELNGNTLTIGGPLSGTVFVNSTSAVGNSGTLINQGSLSGSGIISGDLQNASSGSILVDISGTDELGIVGLDVAGAATLDGTLLISLVDGFIPSNGDTFTVLTASSIDPNGLVLGGDSSNFSFSVVGGTDLVLSYSTGLSGDFNNDGVVNGFDFLLWQTDPNIGLLSDWEANYGNSLASTTNVVPEPSALVLCMAGSCAFTLRRRKRHPRSSSHPEETKGIVGVLALPKFLCAILVLAAVTGICANRANATELIFSFDYCGAGPAPGTCNAASNGFTIVDEYGDRVDATSQLLVASDDFGGTDWYNFYYEDEGEGFTPNVVVDYLAPLTPAPISPNFKYWDTLGGLTDAAWPDADAPGPANWAMTFTADPNVQVRIDSLQVHRALNFGADSADITVNVYEGNDPNNLGSLLWTSGTTSVNPNAAPVTFSPSPAATANSLTLLYEFGTQADPNGELWDWAIDNVRFSQIGGGIATSAEWQLDENGRWRTPSNWAPDVAPGIVADGNDRTALFGSATTGTTTVVLEDGVTLKRLELNHSQKYILAGTGSLTMEADSGNASIDVSGGVTHEIAAELYLNDDTDVTLAAGTTLEINNKLSLNGFTLSTSGTGTLDINNVVDTGGGTVSLLSALVSGSGTIIGDLENIGGTVAPGNSPGKLTVLGDYVQSDDGTLLIELGGTESGSEYDVFRVEGTASLDGLLEVVLIDGFSPEVGDEFNILDFGELLGSFAEVKLPGWITWDTSSLESEGTLIVASVPEPGSIALGMVPLLFAVALRRQGKANFF